MPKKRKSSLGRKTRTASRAKSRFDEEDEQQTQARRDKVRKNNAFYRANETTEQTEERYALKRTREQQNLTSMKMTERTQLVCSCLIFPKQIINRYHSFTGSDYPIIRF